MNSITEYASSSDEEEEKNPAVSSMPKLPSFFDSQPSSSSTTSSSDGRKRIIPHQTNCWATFVYFQVDIAEDRKSILNHFPTLTEIEEQHISISKTIYLKFHQLDSFVDKVRDALRDRKSFQLSFAQLAQLTNDEKTRSFLTLEVSKGYNELTTCTKRVDKVMRQLKKPVFYNPPRFHTSIAWSLKEQDIVITDQGCIEHLRDQVFHVTKVYIKQGNRINLVELE